MPQMEEDSKRGEDQGQGERFLESSYDNKQKKRKRKLWRTNGKNKAKHQQYHPSQAILK